MILIALAVASQEAPQDIAKANLPKSAVCVVCASHGETHGEERAAAGVRYAGKSYFFCDTKEVADFKKDPEAYIPPVLPRPAAKLSAATVDGKTVSWNDYKGKVVLLDFWATWCAPCVKAMPEMEKLQNRFAGKDFVVLGVSIDEDPKKAVAFQQKRKLSYPVLLDDPKDPSWAAWKVRAIPAVFLVDREGQVVRQWRGKVDPKAVEKAVEELVGK